MSRHYMPIALALSLTAVVASRSTAQQTRPPQEVYWSVSYYQVDWPKVDSLMKLIRAYTLPQVDEAKKLGGLMDYRILIHYMAGRDNVVIMQKYSSWAAVHDTTMAVAERRILPDSTKRHAVEAAFRSILGGGLHRDEIYTEVTKQ